MHNFDEVIERRQTHSVKWDTLEQTYHRKDLLPLWIADMDFPTAPAIQTALQNYLQQTILGYHTLPEELFAAVINWQTKRHDYRLTKKEILFNSGVVPSMALAVQAFTKPGEAVLIHDPVYPPFAAVVRKNKRRLIRSQLKAAEKLTMNFDQMEQLIIEENVKLFLLCSPHNPGGRVWSREELLHVGKLCQKHQVIVVSDEIHQDLVFAPQRFLTYHNAAPDFSEHALVLTSATKTFNLAGIKNSMVFIKNPALKKQFQKIQQQNQQHEINTLGIIGTQAAYTHGEAWLEELLVYLQENIRFAAGFFREHLPKVSVMEPEATYLMWLDFSAYGLSDSQLQKKMIEEAGVVLNPGITFGPSGSQYMRLNLACPRSLLTQALERIAAVF